MSTSLYDIIRWRAICAKTGVIRRGPHLALAWRNLLAAFVLVAVASTVHAQEYGVVSMAGSSDGTSGSVDDAGADARFRNPTAIARDSAGNLFVADTNNHTIRKITASGVVTTLAGTAGQTGSADGSGSAARFYRPSGVAVDSAGNVYVADTRNNTIRKITGAGVVSTVAGSAGLGGFLDDTGGAARFNGPTGLAVDSSGNIYVADTQNDVIRKITPAGVVGTVAGKAGIWSAGSAGDVDGTGNAARFLSPAGLALDGTGNLYVTDSGYHTIRKVTPAGEVSTFAGSTGVSGDSDGTGADAQFGSPTGIALDASGNVFVTDPAQLAIRKITPSRVVTTLKLIDPATGRRPQLVLPSGLTIDSTGTLHLADSWNHNIRKVSPSP